MYGSVFCLCMEVFSHGLNHKLMITSLFVDVSNVSCGELVHLSVCSSVCLSGWWLFDCCLCILYPFSSIQFG